MKLKVVLNKDIAFSNYLRHVINLERWPWTKKGPLKRIPLRLSHKAKEFGWPIKFSFERHPIKDFDRYIGDFKKIMKKAEKLHNQDWKKYQRELNQTAKTLKEIVKNYGSFIIKTISSLTKSKWQYPETWLIPSLYSGGTVVDNKIFIGFDERSKEKFLSLVIHELIHINEPLDRDFQNKLNLPTDSKEIATVILTNMIIKSLNNKFKLSIPYQNFHVYYRELIKKHERDLKNLSKGKKSYKPLIESVDNLLTKKGYKGYYNQFRR